MRALACASGALALLVAARDARAAAATMTVNWVRDEFNNTEYYSGSPAGAAPLDSLNAVSDWPHVHVEAGTAKWWEARLTDPHPGTIPEGGFLISAVATVQYEMTSYYWSGSLTLEARTGATLLGTRSLYEYTSPTQRTWDLTDELNGQADPLAALNGLAIRMVNSDPTYLIRVNWSHVRVDVVYGGPPAALAFAVEPSDTTAGEAISPPLQVSVRDIYGNTVPYATDGVTLAIDANPGLGTLSGTSTVAAVEGVATFPDLSIDRAGVGYTLEAASGALAPATSVEFSVSPGEPSALRFIAEPCPVQVGNAISPPVRVAISDWLGNTVPGESGTVTVAIQANPGGGTLSGVTTVGTVNGVASFMDLKIDAVGDGYTLEATSSGLASATSTAFSVVPDPLATMIVNWARDNASGREYYEGSPDGTSGLDMLNSPLDGDKVDVGAEPTAWWEARYTDPCPTTVPAGGFLISVVVSVRYKMDVVAWDGTLALEARTSAGMLGSTTLPEHPAAAQETWDVTALLNAEADPLAALNDLGVRMVNDDPTAGKKVLWSYTKVEVLYGGPPQKVVFEVEPTDAIAGEALLPAVRVAVQDVYGNTVANSTAAVTVAIAANPAGGALSGATTVAASGGVATFSDLAIDEAGTGYALVVWAPGLVSAMTGTFDVLVPPPGAFLLLAPSDAAANVPLVPALQWGASAFAEGYALLVAEDASFVSVVVDEPALAETSYAFPEGLLEPETEYFWRVTASNSTGTTAATGNDFSFTTRPRCAIEVSPGAVGFIARPGSTEVVQREVLVTNSGPAGSVAEVTIGWTAPPGVDIAISEPGFTLAAGESRTVSLVLDPAAAAGPSSFDLVLDVSAVESADAPRSVQVTVDLEPYGAAGIGCEGSAARGRGAGRQWASIVLLALVLTVARPVVRAELRRR